MNKWIESKMKKGDTQKINTFYEWLHPAPVVPCPEPDLEDFQVRVA